MSYPSHRAHWPETQAAIEASIDLIYKGYTYCEAGKVFVLSQLKIKKQTFYNLCTQLDLDKEFFENYANGIKEALTELGYKWHARYTYNINDLFGKIWISIHQMLLIFSFLIIPAFLVGGSPKSLGNKKLQTYLLKNISQDPTASGKIPYYLS